MALKPKIIIAGAGGIGQAAGLILACSEALDCDIVFGDISEAALKASSKFVKEGSRNAVVAKTFLMSKSGANASMKKQFKSADIILDCLPGSVAPRIASFAREYKMHYANLTEYVKETEEVKKIAKGAKTAFVLQTGLAPGFINVLACKLFEDFTKKHKVSSVDQLKMKVGALSQHALSPHYYAFTWSPIGVATEYLKDAIVVRDYEKKLVSPLSGRERIIIDGDEYEDNFTSGGAADLPDAFSGKVRDLDYKTLRYVGHYAWVETILSSVPQGSDKIRLLERIMLNTIPSVEDDEVLIYASVTGKDKKGRLRSKEKSYKIYPSMVGSKKLRAIQSTTASALCQIAYMLLNTKGWKGAVFQSEIPTDDFLNGPFVKQFYGGYE